MSATCGCGCGVEVKSGRTYRVGHHVRVLGIANRALGGKNRRGKHLLPATVVACACGCGQDAKPRRKYIHGHNPVPHTPERKAATSIRMLERNPMFDAVNVAKMTKTIIADPVEMERRRQQVSGLRNPMRDSAIRSKRSATVKECGSFVQHGISMELPIGTRRKLKINRQFYWAIKVDSPDVWEYEHRVVMSTHLGRTLASNELVHHKDEDGLNNAIDNLALTTRVGHPTIHAEITRARR